MASDMRKDVEEAVGTMRESGIGSVPREEEEQEQEETNNSSSSKSDAQGNREVVVAAAVVVEAGTRRTATTLDPDIWDIAIEAGGVSEGFIYRPGFNVRVTYWLSVCFLL